MLVRNGVSGLIIAFELGIFFEVGGIHHRKIEIKLYEA